MPLSRFLLEFIFACYICIGFLAYVFFFFYRYRLESHSFGFNLFVVFFFVWLEVVNIRMVGCGAGVVICCIRLCINGDVCV